MDDEEDIDKDEEVVGVPEGIEARDPIKWLGKFHQAPPEPPGS